MLKIVIETIYTIIFVYLSLPFILPFRLKNKTYVFMAFANFFTTIATSCFLPNRYLVMVPFAFISTLLIYMDGNNELFVSISAPLLAIIISIVSNYIGGLILMIPTDIPYLLSITIFMILDCIIILLISMSIGRFANEKMRFFSLFLSKKLSSIILLAFFIILSLFYANIYFGYQLNFPYYIIVINAVSFLLLFIMLIIIVHAIRNVISHELEVDHRETALRDMENYTKILESYSQEMRKYRHDIGNMIIAMKSLIDQGNAEETKKYFDKHIMPFTDNLEKSTGTLEAMGNIELPGIRTFIYAKLVIAQSKGVNAKMFVEGHINRIGIDTLDFIRILGILMDNAIEGCMETESMAIGIGFRKYDKGLVVAISNSYNGEINITRIFSKGYSTKGDDRGLGLVIAKELCDKYKNIKLNTMCGEEFTQELTINH